MVRDEKETVLERVLYSGKEGEGLSFEKLDEKMQSWGRKKFGDRYARDLWRNELLELKSLKLGTDELYDFAFDIHCSEVYDMLSEENSRQADGLFYSDRFWTVEWQSECRQRQREKLFCHLETLCTGEAARQVQKQGVRKMKEMRSFLFQRFGAGKPEVLEKRVKHYLEGMPCLKTGLAFPPRCNMEDKLNALEKEREYLLDMCPKEKREAYDDAKETTLTRMIIRKLPKEYDIAVKAVRDLHRFRSYGKSGEIGSITNLEDNTRRNYETEWLPLYQELRYELIAEYNQTTKRREEDALAGRKEPGHPTLVLQGFEQPGPRPLTCYGCGQPGHRRGDPTCTAGTKDVWHGAPEGFKELIKKRGVEFPKGGKGKGGKGKGNPAQRNARQDDKEKGICFNWSRGNGYCKFAEACRFKHEGPKGGGGGGKRNHATLVSAKGGPKKKQKRGPAKGGRGIAAMVMKDLKAMMDQGGGIKEESDNEKDNMSLFKLVRGEKGKKRVNFLVTSSEGGREYVPSRYSSLMINAREGKEDFKPRRGRSGMRNDEDQPNHGKVKTHTRFATPKKKRTSPCSEEGSESPKEKGQKKSRPTRSNKQASVENEGGLQEDQDCTLDERGLGKSASSSVFKTSPPKAKGARGSSNTGGFQPAWGRLKGFDDHLDDVRMDSEWGGTQERHDRREHDKQLGSGRSPPPKGIGRKSASRTSRELDGQLWGREWGEDTMDFKAPGSFVEVNEPCEDGPDCKFGVKRNVKGKAFSGAKPKAIKEKEGAPQPLRLFDRSSPGNGKDEAPPSPLRISEDDGSKRVDGKCSEERTFLVRVKPGMEEAEVMFLSNEKANGYEGPFDLKTSLQSLLKFDLLPISRKPWVIKGPALSDVVEGGSDRDESDGVVEDPPVVARKTASGALEKHLSGRRGAGFDEIMASAINESRVKKALESVPLKPWMDLFPKYEVGELVLHYDRHEGDWRWWRAWIETIIIPTETQYRDGMVDILYQICPHPIENKGNERVIIKEYRLRAFRAVHQSYGDPRPFTSLPTHLEPLHSMEVVGIDTCSALSVSTRREDFLFLDVSPSAINSIVLRGVGGSDAKIGGRGPMVVLAEDEGGGEIVLIDPAGVYLEEAAEQADFRILGQLRMQKFGFDLVQNGNRDGKNHLIYRDGMVKILLGEDSGILTLKTKELLMHPEERRSLDLYVDKLLEKDKGEWDHCLRVTRSSLVMNEAHLSKLEQQRLMHWRTAHRVSLDPGKAKEKLNEDCVVCDEAKRKTRGYKRNFEFTGLTKGPMMPFFRLYMDGYGGQSSMGDLSYEGAIGGFVFACPTGSVKQKLYGSTDQLPAIMFQIFQEIESEGYVCRELYVDTHSVNLSRAAEEVAAMFRVKIIPVSAGTPQEMAYAESAVRTIGEMSRVLMAGAKHLPSCCWGLSDLWAAYLHNLLPQKKAGMSPFEYRNHREPDLDLFFVHVFGCPCQYAPIQGAEHKRASKTEWAWFVGMQWPMVLLLRPEDNKVISVSRHKVHCHEEAYAKYDPTTGGNPLEHFAVPKVDLEGEKTKGENLQTIKEYKEKFKIPDHVLSVKCLSDFRRHPEMNEALPRTAPPENMEIFFDPQHSNQGEKIFVPDLDYSDIDAMLEEIKEMKDESLLSKRGEGKVETLRRALQQTIELGKNTAPRKNQIKKVKRKRKSRSEIRAENVVNEERKGKERNLRVPVFVPPPEPPEGTITNIDDLFEQEEKEIVEMEKSKKNKGFKVLDRVMIKTTRFGKSFAKGRQLYTFGTIMKMKGKVCDVQWDDSEEVDLWKSHTDFLEAAKDNVKGDVVAALYLLTEPWLDDRTNCTRMMLPILEIGCALAPTTNDETTNLPRDFFEALIREDWRDWVSAVKAEIDSWSMFEAATVVPYHSMARGASIIPLGELFSVKRNGKKKFRQYAMGNLLKEGKDFGETFSSTVSGDGLRWFCSLAVTCAKVIKGWDAQTGYLQCEQRIPVYAYLPSHHGFSDLEFEQLGPLRFQLMGILKDEGLAGVKKFARSIRKDRRDKPVEVLRLDKSIYGIPDAGQSFSMYMTGLHQKHCGLIQSEMDPCVFYKIMQDENAVVVDYIVVITWVDDCRYFGTEPMVDEYEKNVKQHCKCVFDGESKEFVSIEISHDVKGRTLELTQTDYWVKAVARFAKFIPEKGPTIRKVPLSAADEKLLVEPTAEEMKLAEHLPYASLLGVCQYPSSFTRLETRYAMSVLSRHRTKWGTEHFRILIKALEYGYSTKEMGLKYSCSKDRKRWNKLVGFADSSFTLPRSQGCREVMMNGAAISFTSKRHTTTDESTTSAELTEAYLLACDVEGFRTLMAEIGLRQEEPTVLWQDNQSAITIAMNRGSLAKKTRAMEVRVLSIRNKIEDMKVVPHYLPTDKMIADIGTKALEPKQFCLLRDKLCGYAEWEDDLG